MNNNLIGVAVGILTAAVIISQYVHLMKEQRTSDISFSMLIVLFLINGLWVYYSLMVDQLPVTIINAISLFMTSTLLIFKVASGQRVRG